MSDDKLTLEDINILKSPFAPSEHEFLQGFTYVKEFAICGRIEEVDPAWSMELVGDPLYRDGKGGVCFVTICMAITIKGVRREGIGMSETFLVTKKGDTKDKEAEKNAATDALKRTARLFGVGRYLTEIDNNDNVRNSQDIQRWLTKNQHLFQGAGPRVSQQHPTNVTQMPPSEPPPREEQPQRQQSNNGNRPEPGTIREVVIAKREVRANKKGNPYLLFTAQTGERVSAFTRETFKEQGYCSEYDWQTVGESETMHMLCKIKMGDNGYWDFISASIPKFNPGWDDLTNQQSLPGTPEPPTQNNYDNEVSIG